MAHGSGAPQPSGKRGKAPKPRIKSGGTTLRAGQTKPSKRGNKGGKG